MDDLVCVKKFDKIDEAEIARSVLESEGIKAVVFRNDFGGLYPGLFHKTGHRLMVAGQDLASARKILESLNNGC